MRRRQDGSTLLSELGEETSGTEESGPEYEEVVLGGLEAGAVSRVCHKNAKKKKNVSPNFAVYILNNYFLFFI